MLDLTPVGPGQTVDDALYERDQARIAALEAELAERTRERDDERKRREDAGAELAAERERRRAVEKDAVRCQGLRAAQRDTLDEKSRLISAMGSRNSMLDAELAAERERREAAEWVLKEIRIRLHAAGRRPEECWEMSEIDGHFAHFAHYKD